MNNRNIIKRMYRVLGAVGNYVEKVKFDLLRYKVEDLIECGPVPVLDDKISNSYTFDSLFFSNDSLSFQARDNSICRSELERLLKKKGAEIVLDGEDNFVLYKGKFSKTLGVDCSIGLLDLVKVN